MPAGRGHSADCRGITAAGMTPLSSACRSKMIDFEQRVAGVSGLGASRLMLCLSVCTWLW